MALRNYVVGNWKMHGLSADLAEIQEIADGAEGHPDVDVALCVPAILIERAARAVPASPSGRRTSTSRTRAPTRAACPRRCSRCRRKADHCRPFRAARGASTKATRTSDAKAEAALSAGLGVILCIGESLDVREEGDAVGHRPGATRCLLAAWRGAASGESKLAIAYEPIWAIGTGKSPSTADIAEMHAALRERLVGCLWRFGKSVRILYGGSVNAANAADIFAVDDVDGALVGGASLTADKFLPIVEAAAGCG